MHHHDISSVGLSSWNVRKSGGALVNRRSKSILALGGVIVGHEMGSVVEKKL